MDYEEERRRLKSSLILRRRRIRDMADPFNVTEEAFAAKYHLTQDLVRSIVDMVRPHVRRTTSALAVPLEIKVLCALAFYAKGSYQAPTGQSFDIAVAQPTVSKILDEITDALNLPQVAGRLIQFPRTRAQQEMCCERNRTCGGRIPKVVGYVDGSLFKISRPTVAQNVLAYIGRKNFPCVNVQFVCDRRMYFLNCLARFPGSAHDQYIFNQSNVRQIMADLHNPEDPCFLLGDSGYNPEPWILTPFARGEEPQENTPESRYNIVHSKDRVSVEQALGFAFGRFRCLSSERTLHYSPRKAFKFILACTALHNMCILSRNRHYLDNHHGQVRDGEPIFNDEPADLHEYLLDGNLVRQGKLHRRQVVQYLEQHRQQNGL